MSTAVEADRLAALAGVGLSWHPSGQAGLRGPLLALAEECDRAFVQIAALWDAEEERHSATIQADALQRVGYLRSFPQQATFPVSLDPAEANLDAFVNGEVIANTGHVSLTRLAPNNDVLIPASCYHLYAAHDGACFDRPIYLTTSNSCFRQEAEYVPLRRLRSFTMREIVCFGDSRETSAFVDRTRSALDVFLSLVDLPVDWRPATDCFFRPESNPEYIFQRLQPAKLEATYDDSLAIASANLHHDHFGVGFNLMRGDKPATTACVAFGLERWLFAITDRHGMDPRSWPAVADAASSACATMQGHNR